MKSSSLPTDPDRAFADFFRAQVPAPWPACPVPAAAKAVPATDSPWSSRHALAASVALLLGLGLAFSGSLAPPRQPATHGDLTGGATADGKDLLKHADPMKNLPTMP
jgi:hypothetical protein